MTKMLSIIVFVLFLFNTSLSQGEWTLQSTVSGLGDCPAISIFSPTGVVVAGGVSGQPKVLISTDSGVNWTDITNNLAGNPDIYSVWAVDENVIFAGDGGSNDGNGGNAKVWKTTNGGANWTTILKTNGWNGFINGITFSRTMPNFGIIQSDPPAGNGQPYWIAKTTDGGSNWTITHAPGITGSSSVLSTVKVIDSLFYGFGTTYPTCKVYLTKDGGTTWDLQNSGFFECFITDFAFSSDKKYGITASVLSLPTISRTTNGGVNWSLLNTGGGLTGWFCRMIWVYGTSTCYLTSEAGAGGTIMKSVDNGATWVTQKTAGITMLFSIDLIYVSGTVYAYAIAENGSIIKLQETLVGVEPITHNMPLDYKLEQNYPNPFNPTTTIRFGIIERGNVRLCITNTLGEEIRVLLNEEKEAGYYSIEFSAGGGNASGLPSGVYFYKIDAGNFIETKKMLLLK